MGTIHFIRPNDQWEKKLDNIEQEAGMMAGGVALVSEIQQGVTPMLSTVQRDVTSMMSDIQYANLASSSDISDFRTEYRIPEDDAIVVNIPKRFGWWIRSDLASHYNLYVFDTAYFVQGFISICTHFEVDFRDYALAWIFDYEGRKYTIADYTMEAYPLTMDAINLDDVEEEEADNESIGELDVGKYKSNEF